MSKTELVSLSLPASTWYIRRTRLFISGIAQDAGFSENTASQVELAMDEALTNVIRHAYAEQSEHGTVVVLLEKDADQLTIRLRDWGNTFSPDWKTDLDVDQMAKDKKRGGLGLFIIQRVMDEVDYRRCPQGYNELTMVKHFSAKSNDL